MFWPENFLAHHRKVAGFTPVFKENLCRRHKANLPLPSI